METISLDVGFLYRGMIRNNLREFQLTEAPSITWEELKDMGTSTFVITGPTQDLNAITIYINKLIAAMEQADRERQRKEQERKDNFWFNRFKRNVANFWVIKVRPILKAID